MKTKIKLYLIFVFFALGAYLVLSKTYALFESEASIDGQLPIAKWSIKLNDVLASGSEQSITLNDCKYTELPGVEKGYIAPGNSAYCTLKLDPTGTEVAVRFDIDFTKDEESEIYADNITYTVEAPAGTTIYRTGENVYTGLLGISSVNLGKVLELKITINWEDDGEHDITDSQYGMTVDKTFEVPAKIKVTQYLGEGIQLY